MSGENNLVNSIDKDAPLLITGSAGFVGQNLVARLRALGFENLLLYDIHSTKDDLRDYTQRATFVFHLAGVNRPQNTEEFYAGNAGLTGELVALLEEAQNPAPLLLSSSAQAGNGSDYAKSKEQAEAAVLAHGEKGGKALVFRLPGVFGKWCRPGYNSVVATFCHKIAHGEAIEVRDEAYAFPLCYIDDVVDCFLAALRGEVPAMQGVFCAVQPVYETTLGQLAAAIRGFASGRAALAVPLLDDPFTRKLYATFLSYLPRDGFAQSLQPKCDERGSFTEFLRTPERGQMSVNVAKPGITKGNHWHDTKHEVFFVVSGKAAIRFRRLGEDEVFEYLVNGEDPQPIVIPPGYTHNIENLGKENLVTLMWASEPFNPARPDTYFEEV